MKIAFVGMGQSYPSTVWMGRMRKMLADRVVVNIDDMRNVDRGVKLAADTRYVPRKMNYLNRFLSAVRLSNRTHDKLRSQWMLQTITQSGAKLAFVHFLDYATRFTDVWRQLDMPVVVHCHGYDITWDLLHPDTLTSYHAPGYTALVRALPDNVWFIANSTHTKDQLLQLSINPNKIFLKRFGVPLSDRPRSESQQNDTSILFLGRLVDFKGPLETAHAFSQIPPNYPQLRLDVAGDGGLGEDLDRLILELGLSDHVVRHGFVSPARGKELRGQAAIFTAHNQTDRVTNQKEAFGVSMLEAMGEGVPVVTGRSGGIPDFIQHDQNGLLFQSGDINSHAEMLDDLMSSKKRRMSLGTAAWETVRDNYQADHELEDMTRIFQHVSEVGSLPTISETISSRAA